MIKTNPKKAYGYGFVFQKIAQYANLCSNLSLKIYTAVQSSYNKVSVSNL